MPLIRGEEIIIPTINHNQFVNTIDYNTVINQPIINVIYNIVYPMINNNIFFEWRNIQNIEEKVTLEFYREISMIHFGSQRKNRAKYNILITSL